jgi:hypothetical protein
VTDPSTTSDAVARASRRQMAHLRGRIAHREAAIERATYEIAQLRDRLDALARASAPEQTTADEVS